ncbi:protoheme IX farnesyltransferase [Klebsiella variicola]|uniref:Protoheme IX farnesyltransferase n=1 Tax=Klebsiella variicola TaxID=244366 RepID=A0A7H4MAC5_KLEVA|nr:protoheme IX farnesyltransferase [Klebsiella variicola]
MTLDMLNVMLAVSEEGMIEEMLLALLALLSWRCSLRNSPA